MAKIMEIPVPRPSEEIFAHVVQPDILLPYEYQFTLQRQKYLEPEKELMAAVLEDAIRSYRRYAGGRAKSSSSRRLVRDIERWIYKNDWNWPFSFLNICAVLNLNADFLRDKLPNAKSRASTETFKGKMSRIRKATKAA